MPLNPRPVVKQSVLLSGGCVLLSALAGCSSVSVNPSVSQVRIIDTSPDAPGLDMYQGTGVLAYNLGFGTITSYVPITPGVYSIGANTAGSGQKLISARGTFNAAAEYTVLVGNSAAALQETILQDQSQSAPSGQIALRFIDQATHIGGVDVYLVPTGSKLADVTPILTNMVFGTTTKYLNEPTGTYSLVVLAAGTVPVATTIAFFSGASVAYSGGSAKTVILLDQQLLTSPGVQTITASDYDPAGSS